MGEAEQDKTIPADEWEAMLTSLSALRERIAHLEEEGPGAGLGARLWRGRIRR